MAKKKGEKQAFINNLIHSFVLLTTLTISHLIIDVYNLSNVSFIVFPFDYLMVGFIALFYPLFYLLIIREKRKLREKTEVLEEKESLIPELLPMKYEIYRKLTHLVVLAIVFFYFTLGLIIQNVFLKIIELFPEDSDIRNLFYSIFTIEGDIMIFTQCLGVFLVGISLIGLLTAEFVRILFPKIYPLKPVNRILRERELYMRLGPQISMAIGCFSIIILYGLFQPLGPLIICTSMTMSIFGDMAANLFGRTLGKTRKRIRNTKKTYVGLFAGMMVAFFSGFLMLILLNDFYPISLLGLFLIPLVGTLIIGILDYLDLVIDDNLSYNITVTTVLFYLAIFIG
jgi:CDP-diglyceride synthetase